MGNLKGIREADAFIGGEKLPVEERITGSGFYETMKEVGFFGTLYKSAEAKRLDIYEQGSRLIFGLANGFRKAHTGVLTMYVTWVLLGLTVLLIVLMGR
jgi:hypothetical protein